MIPVAFIVLAIFILTVLNDRPAIAVVLAGLLIFIWNLLSKITNLKLLITELDDKFSILKDRIKKLESVDANLSTKHIEPVVEMTAVAEDEKAKNQTQHQNESSEPVITPDAPVVEKSPPSSSRTQEVKPAAISETATKRGESSPSRHLDPKPIGPSRPGFIDRAWKALWSWFTDGNTFVRVGVIILFMGMTFLISYAIEKNLLPIELRLAAVGIVSIVMLYWGWRQRITRKTFSLVVQGGGIGLLYLTIFAGFSLYHVIPSGTAFTLLFLIVLMAAMLAIFQDAKSLALFATVGGFLAPILTSSGSNNYIGLFSYYTILNLGIFAIVWFKSWRILNFIGFLFTFAIATTWGVLKYRPEYFATTEPFLIIFFLMYVAIGVIYARNRTKFYKDYVDSSLVFGTPLLAFGLQCAMVKDYEYGVAIGAFSLAAFYIVLTNFLWNKYGERLRLLTESVLSLGVIFATLAIPFAIDGTLTGATWAIEGAGILWVSIKQEQKYRRFFAVALIFAASIILLSEIVLPLSGPHIEFNYAFANSAFIGCLIIAIAACGSSWLLSRDYQGKHAIEKSLSPALLVYGLVVLFAGFEYQISEFSLHRVHGVLIATLSSVGALCFIIAGNRLKWGMARWVSLLSVVPMAAAAILCYAYQPQLSAHYGYLIWPVSLIIYFYGLRQSLTAIPQLPLLLAHIVVAVILVGLLFWDGIWQLMLCYSLLAIVFNRIGDKWSWPDLKILALGFLPVLILCSIAAITVDGNLIDLSSLSADIVWPFPPGYVLWPFSFVVYFHLLHQSPRIGKYSTSNMHYAGAVLVYVLLLWLGLWPLLLGVSLLSILCCALWRRYSWQEMYFTSMALLPVMWLITCISLLGHSGHPFYLQDYHLNLQINSELGYLLWPLAFVGLFWSYGQYDKQSQSAPALLHSFAIILPVLLITWEASWHMLDYVAFKNAWHLAWLPLIALLVIAMVMKLNSWPFSVHRNSYYRIALPILFLAPAVWSLLQLVSSGNSAPLDWIPLLNPVDIVQAIIVMGILLRSDDIVSIARNSVEKKHVIYTVLAFLFLWANVDLLRAVHHWADIPWRAQNILTEDISQTVLSLFWALTGLFTTLYSSRKQKRPLWIFGATLLGIVVLKLFVIDLSAQDTVERIISFSGVGLLLMLVGYFSPLPPRKIIEGGEA